VFGPDELDAIARVCVAHDLVAITDEVYEHLVFTGEHRPLATFPGMRERTVSISSAGKTFSFTGWKIGWACAPAPLLDAVRSVKQFLTYVSGGPFQYAIAVALGLGDDYYRDFEAGMRLRRDRLCEGLADAGFTVFEPAGTYFVTADARPLGATDGRSFCLSLPERCGVVAVPTSVFYDDVEAGRTLIRFACCKRLDVLDEAVARLRTLAPPS
jgi:N-succinyldiaminopimelate aminotransferase